VIVFSLLAVLGDSCFGDGGGAKKNSGDGGGACEKLPWKYFPPKNISMVILPFWP